MARGRPPAHTRDQVVAAAIRVADAEGLAAVSMRRIAAEIGAGAMSLYTYVPDKERLLDLMVDAVGGESAPAPATGDWRADLLAVAGRQRALMHAHPWLPAALPNRRLTGRNMLAYLEQGLAALAPTGLDGPTKLELIALLTGFVAAFVTAELASAAAVSAPAGSAAAGSAGTGSAGTGSAGAGSAGTGSAWAGSAGIGSAGAGSVAAGSAAAGSAAAAEQVALIGEAVASGDFPHLAGALAAGVPAREPSFDRLASWMIAGLVEQARAAG